jgi:hypothetical protein
MKFGRIYKLTIQIGTNKAIEIKYPTTLSFDIDRTCGSQLNQATFRLYGLSNTTRDKIYKDRYNIIGPIASDAYSKIILEAGYQEQGGSLSTIFKGSILEAYSYREGSEIITYINAQDGGYGVYNSYSSKTFESGTPVKEVFKTLIKDMQDVTLGTIGALEGSLGKRGLVLEGNTYDLLKNSFNNQVFIDLNKINILNPNEAIAGNIPSITASSGLLNTPTTGRSRFITIETLFEPRLAVGHIINVESKINPRINGQYKIDGIKHSGIISGATIGECTTTLQLFIGTRVFGNLEQV